MREDEQMKSMSNAVGSVASLWRYPVKSMMGEELNTAEITKGGLFGDRAYALVDTSDGKIASAKNPRKWPNLFDFSAGLADVSGSSAEKPPVRIILPDGTAVSSQQSDVHQILSKVLKREVRLSGTPGLSATGAEEYWPDMEGLDFRDTVTDFNLPEGTFFDAASVHLLTTATLNRLAELYPQRRRFRPNIVVETGGGAKDFVETAWIGKVLAVGDTVRLSIIGRCGRCVMTTLSQGDLPKDPGILRTAAQHNRANVGVYASVLQAGMVRSGDSVRLE
jgi:MOSC domain-containing protein